MKSWKPFLAQFFSFNMRVESSFYQADLATGRERQLTTGKRAERTKHDFRHWSGQLFDFARRRQLTLTFFC